MSFDILSIMCLCVGLSGNIYVISKTNMSWKVTYVIKKVRQLFGKYIVSKNVSSVGVKVGTDRNTCGVVVKTY